MKFLIVDDSLAMQSIIKRSLNKAGYKDNDYQMAQDGIQALKIIESWQPDVVITDLHMPKMSGIELLTAIKEKELDLKAGLVTTETNPNLIAKAKDAGALFVLHKPFELTDLQKTIIPIIHGTDAKQQLLSNLPSNDGKSAYDLQLPSIPGLKKIAVGFDLKNFEFIKSSSMDINYAYLPYVIVLFTGADKTLTKAMCILDIRAAAMLCCAFDKNAAESIKKIIKDKALTKTHLDKIAGLMDLVSALFYDPLTQQDLEVKGVHMIPKPFDRLDQLGSTSKDKRLDLTIRLEGLGEGQVIFMAVADN